MKSILVSSVALLALTLTPGISRAADTYVSPNGTGNACSQAAPCSILIGGNEAEASSAIVLAPGQYGSPSDPINDRIYTTAPNVNYIGRADAVIYVDSTATDASVTIYSGQKFLGYGTRIISADQIGIGVYGSALVDRVNLRTSAVSSTACQLSNEGILTGGTVRNSLCVAGGFGSSGIYLRANGNDQFGTVNASTGIALDPGGIGIGVENKGTTPGGSGFSELDVYLSIARAPMGYDLEAGYDTAETNAACLRTYDTAAISIRPNACGVTEDNPLRNDPAFVDPAADFHLTPTSPLVNLLKSTRFPVPAVDLDGKPRDPKSPEPGAYEYQSPIRCVVPRLRGLRMPQVRVRLRRANCSLGRVSHKKVSSRRKAGRVIGQNPRAGQILAANSRVQVTLGRKARIRR